MDTASVVVMGIGSVLTGIYVLILLATGNKYDYLVEPLDKKEYRLPELYTFGFAIMNLTKHKFTSKSELKRRNYITILKGAKFADYYLQIEYAKRVGLVAPIVVVSFAIAGLANELLVCPMMLLISGALFAYIGREPEKKIEARSEELLCDFSDVVSKLALLINAGMIMRQAWEKVAYSGTGTIFTEMQLVVTNMNNGMSEGEAYFEFGNKCLLPEIKKFASTIVQGIYKGNEELAAMLTQQSSEVWTVKMNQVKRQGDAAITKLIAPMMIMFIGILIMIVIPIFSNMGM
ncbi:MAG: type II secretion system F family protein [Lachnospiraceae bacterium]|nr:type II secretion system F family protein [Lachnospiraceae bacterium]